MTTPVALGVAEPRDGEMILESGRIGAGWRPDRLSGQGYFLVPGQHETPRPARAYWLTDAAMRPLPAAVASTRRRWTRSRPTRRLVR